MSQKKCCFLLQLFDHIADCIYKFVSEHKLQGAKLPLGFTFSFPCRQHGLAKATLVTWTKGFKCAGVEGNDIVELLHEAIKRHGVSVFCRFSSVVCVDD
jgi:hexokinase